VHESSKLQDYSPSGACFFTMSEVQVGMQVTLHISLPVRMARPLVLKGEVVRVDDRADVGGMFKAAGVRWLADRTQGWAGREIGYSDRFALSFPLIRDIFTG
jgi:hypothetical protein